MDNLASIRYVRKYLYFVLTIFQRTHTGVFPYIINIKCSKALTVTDQFEKIWTFILVEIHCKYKKTENDSESDYFCCWEGMYMQGSQEWF